MEVVFDFLKSNYRWIIDILVFVFGFIALLAKKRIKISKDNLLIVLQSLPEYINDAENQKYTGSSKKAYVISRALQSLVSNYGDDIVNDQKIVKYLGDRIEEILSTPQKKESEV